MTKLILIRGLPGSGKSTMAKNMKPMFHIEADMFFTDATGNYNYDATKIKQAHQWCYDWCCHYLSNARPNGIVIVSNTFVKCWELSKYIDLAKNMNVGVEIIVATGNYKNIHGVTQDVIDRMRSTWENNAI